MSQIIINLICKHCNENFNTYISFGHPQKSFKWKWKCINCNNINIEQIEALPEIELVIENKRIL